MPACAGMTVFIENSVHTKHCHTREGGCPICFLVFHGVVRAKSGLIAFFDKAAYGSGMVSSNKRKVSQSTDSRAVVQPPQIVVASSAPSAAAPERVGDILRRERERRGGDLQQIAEHLCIRPSFLMALENSRYESFPADAYVIGFLRSYAEYLGLNGKQAIDFYRREMAGRRKKPALVMPVPLSEGRAPSAIVLAGGALAALLIYILWYSLSDSGRVGVDPSLPPTAALVAPAEQAVSANAKKAEENTVASASSSSARGNNAADIVLAVPSAAIETPPVKPSEAPTLAANASTPSPVTSRLVVVAETPSWVLIADAKGRSLYDHVMKAGETYTVPDRQGLTLTTGNVAGLVLMMDGEALPRLSNLSGHITRHFPLDPVALKKQWADGAPD